MEDGIPGGLQHCHKTCCEKGGCHGRRTCRVQRWHHRRDVVFRTGGLAYDSYSKPTTIVNKVCISVKSIYYEHRSREKLLQL